MKLSRTLALALGLTAAIAFTSVADEKKAESKSEKPKPYTLKTCPVSDEKLGEMGKPYVFVHEGREIKLCCESCKKDFQKDPAKYIKKIEKAEKSEKK